VDWLVVMWIGPSMHWLKMSSFNVSIKVYERTLGSWTTNTNNCLWLGPCWGHDWFFTQMWHCFPMMVVHHTSCHHKKPICNTLSTTQHQSGHVVIVSMHNKLIVILVKLLFLQCFSSIFPTPIGPSKRKEPMGYWALRKLAHDHSITSTTTCIVMSWPTTCWCNCSSNP